MKNRQNTLLSGVFVLKTTILLALLGAIMTIGIGFEAIGISKNDIRDTATSVLGTGDTEVVETEYDWYIRNYSAKDLVEINSYSEDIIIETYGINPDSGSFTRIRSISTELEIDHVNPLENYAYLADRELHEEIIKTVKSKLAESVLEQVDTYEFITDGSNQTVLAVRPSLYTCGTVTLVIDIVDFMLGKHAVANGGEIIVEGIVFKESLHERLAHEIAHIVHFSANQTKRYNCKDTDGSFYTFNELRLDCNTYSSYALGCLHENSYLHQFKVNFWDVYHTDHPGMISGWEDRERYLDNHPDEFVSYYAATELVEDFAESFMEFILFEGYDESTIAGQKVAFFEDFPELLELRDEFWELDNE